MTGKPIPSLQTVLMRVPVLPTYRDAKGREWSERVLIGLEACL